MTTIQTIDHEALLHQALVNSEIKDIKYFNAFDKTTICAMQLYSGFVIVAYANNEKNALSNAVQQLEQYLLFYKLKIQ